MTEEKLERKIILNEDFHKPDEEMQRWLHNYLIDERYVQKKTMVLGVHSSEWWKYE